jgi:hypothetical protein
MISITNLLLLSSILCLSFVYLKKENYILSEDFQRRAGFIPLVAAPSLQSEAPTFFNYKEGMRP